MPPMETGPPLYLPMRAFEASYVSIPTHPHDTPAEIEKGPAFHMDEAAVPAGPIGRNVRVQGLESAENGDPE
eukprot:7121324-Alexandrium_andersonii.AAC.1